MTHAHERTLPADGGVDVTATVRTQAVAIDPVVASAMAAAKLLSRFKKGAKAKASEAAAAAAASGSAKSDESRDTTASADSAASPTAVAVAVPSAPVLARAVIARVSAPATAPALKIDASRVKPSSGAEVAAVVAATAPTVASSWEDAAFGDEAAPAQAASWENEAFGGGELVGVTTEVTATTTPTPTPTIADGSFDLPEEVTNAVFVASDAAQEHMSVKAPVKSPAVGITNAAADGESDAWGSSGAAAVVTPPAASNEWSTTEAAAVAVTPPLAAGGDEWASGADAAFSTSAVPSVLPTTADTDFDSWN